MPRVAAPPDVREAILDAAMRLMEWYGYRKMTMEDIAEKRKSAKPPFTATSTTRKMSRFR